MPVLCAWCRAWIIPPLCATCTHRSADCGDLSIGPISHGICVACARELAEKENLPPSVIAS